MEKITTLLKKLPIFVELSEEELNAILAIAKKRQYKSKMMVYMENDPFNRVFFILNGKVKIFKKDMNGREQIVSILQTGDMFPLAVFFSNCGYPANAEVMVDSTLITIDIVDFEKILLNNSEMSIKLYRILGERIIELQARLEEQILRGTYEQIIFLLLRLCRTYGKEDNKGEFVFTTHFTNRELANMVGSTRETVSRTLNKLKKENHLSFDEEGLLRINPEKLKEEVYYNC